MRLFISLLILFFLSPSVSAASFQLNKNGVSHVYFPINDDASKWNIVNGSPWHRGSDTYADDWNLRPGYSSGIEPSSGCNRDRGAEVKSAFSGTVFLADIQGNIGAYGKEVIVRSSDNPSFAMRYAHLDTVYVSNGDVVNTGSPLGTVGNSGTDCAHLHLVLYKNLDSGALTRLKKGNSPKSLYGGADIYAAKFYSDAVTGENVSSTNAGIFDGAGSLVNPSQECYGCDRDIAVMHPHPGAGSTVVFQWLYSGEKCEFLDITADKDVNVIIKSKFWEDHFTENSFKTTLSNTPISFNKSGSWTTFAITSIDSIPSETRVTAKCQKPNDTFHNGSRTPMDPDFVDVTYNYYWTGTGSIISQANRTGYGVRYDIAATFQTKKSLTSFQWYSSDSCNRLGLSDGTSANHNASVSIKPWDFKKFEQVCSSLPCDIIKPSGYYVIKIKSNANEFSGQTVKAECK